MVKLQGHGMVCAGSIQLGKQKQMPNAFSSHFYFIYLFEAIFNQVDSFGVNLFFKRSLY